MTYASDFSKLDLLWPDLNEIPFEEYMRRCLYHPVAGFYSAAGPAVVGKTGDFITSPHLSPLFSRVLGRAVAGYDRKLESPDPLHLIELGSDRGLLGCQLTQFFEQSVPELAGRLRYHPVDFRDEIPCLEKAIVIGNEFFDALPVRRIRFEQGRLQEIFVRRTGPGAVQEVFRETSDPAVVRFLETGFPPLRDGWIYEVNLQMVHTLRELSERIGRGIVISIDYGFLRSEYGAKERADGTLMCYRRHLAHPDPYRAPGLEDMTAHVNFEVLGEAGRELGWQSEPLISQREFLMRWGLAEELLREEKLGILQTERVSERLGIRDLLAPGGISDTMRVLVQSWNRCRSFD